MRIVAPSALLPIFKRATRNKFGSLSCSLASDGIDGSNFTVPIRPPIVDRRCLFGTNDCKINDLNQLNDDSSSSGVIPGPEADGPTSLRKVGEHGDSTFIEEVDNFRFVVDRNALEYALKAKTGMTIEQQRQDGGVSQFYMDADLVQSMVGHEGQQTNYEVMLDYVQFQKSIVANPASVIEHRQRKAPQSGDDAIIQNYKGLRTHLYDEASMQAAESSLGASEAFQDDSTDDNSRTSLQGAKKKKVVRGGLDGSESSPAAVAQHEAWRTVQRSLALTSKSEVKTDIMGVTVVLTGTVLVLMAINTLLSVLRNWVLKGAAVMHMMPVPAKIKRWSGAALLGAIGAAAGLYWESVLRRRRKDSDLQWLGG